MSTPSIFCGVMSAATTWRNWLDLSTIEVRGSVYCVLLGDSAVRGRRSASTQGFWAGQCLPIENLSTEKLLFINYRFRLAQRPGNALVQARGEFCLFELSGRLPGVPKMDLSHAVHVME